MDISGKTVVVTGGGSGIGAAIAKAASFRGARVAVADRNLEGAQKVASECGGAAFLCDVSTETGLTSLIDQVQTALGPIDVFVSNAGLGQRDPSHAASTSDEVWDLNWRVHVMAHVWAARALLPEMIARKSGYFVNVASAAGLLNQIGDAAYSATKHAAVSFAESLAISHGDDGIGVSVVCPQYVATPLIGVSDSDVSGTLLSAREVAQSVLNGVEDDQFLILPHPQVADFSGSRASDHGRWIRGMQKLRAKAIDEMGEIRPELFYKLV